MFILTLVFRELAGMRRSWCRHRTPGHPGLGENRKAGFHSMATEFDISGWTQTLLHTVSEAWRASAHLIHASCLISASVKLCASPANVRSRYCDIMVLASETTDAWYPNVKSNCYRTRCTSTDTYRHTSSYVLVLFFYYSTFNLFCMCVFWTDMFSCMPTLDAMDSFARSI